MQLVRILLKNFTVLCHVGGEGEVREMKPKFETEAE